MQSQTPTIQALNLALSLCRRRRIQLARRLREAAAVPSPAADRARLAVDELERAIETIEALRGMARDAADREARDRAEAAADRRTCRTPFCPRGLAHDPNAELCADCKRQWGIG